MATKPPTKPPRASADSGSSATPSTRKKATPKRGPTKAAALKALGLSQEDLDLLKQVAAAQEAAKSMNVDNAEVSTSGDIPVRQPLTPQEQETLAHNMHLAAINSGQVVDEIPDALKSADERRAAAQAQSTPLFIRNRQNCEVGIRFTRQKNGERRTELKPRGERGDLVRLEQEDYGDPVLDRQLSYNLIEIITLAEAREIIANQSVNARQQVHPALAMLRNPLGEEYAPNAVTVAPEFNSQGGTVATLDPRQMRGELTDTEVRRGAGMQRVDNSNVQPAQPNSNPYVTAPTGGNAAIINDGFARNDAASRDAIARRRDIHGPEAGGITRVTVAPVQRG